MQVTKHLHKKQPNISTFNCQFMVFVVALLDIILKGVASQCKDWLITKIYKTLNTFPQNGTLFSTQSRQQLTHAHDTKTRPIKGQHRLIHLLVTCQCDDHKEMNLLIASQQLRVSLILSMVNNVNKKNVFLPYDLKKHETYYGFENWHKISAHKKNPQNLENIIHFKDQRLLKTFKKHKIQC